MHENDISIHQNEDPPPPPKILMAGNSMHIRQMLNKSLEETAINV